MCGVADTPHLAIIQLDGLYDCGCGEEGKDTPGEHASATSPLLTLTRPRHRFTVSEGKPETDRVDSVTGEELIPGRRG